MRAVDTNVLVRLVVRDDDEQAAAAEEFVAAGAWVSHLVLAETLWVLTSVYALTPGGRRWMGRGRHGLLAAVVFVGRSRMRGQSAA